MKEKHFTMRELPCSEQPYEKCLEHGPEKLSDAELLAVIIRTGSKEKRSVEVAMQILNLHEHHKGIVALHYLTIPELMKIDGIGYVKATQISCIAELSKRLSKSRRPEQICFRQPKEIAEYFMEEMRSLQEEHVKILMLDGKAGLIHSKTLTIGTVNTSIASPREIFRCALRYDAVNIILLHTHPSGNTMPSHEDIYVTKRIIETGDLIGIPLIDHIIIGDGRYTSMKENGYI